MTKTTRLLIFAVLALTFGYTSTAQTQNQNGATYAGQVGGMEISPSLASRSNLIPAAPLTEEPKDGRSVRQARTNVVPGKDPQTENDLYSLFPHRLKNKIPTRGLENDFIVNNTVGSPSDPALAVGPDHVFIVYNTGFIIYDKDGNDLTGPLAVGNIFPTAGCCDLTASYDNAADRWVITFLGAGVQVAVSDGPDPINDNWFIYTLPQIADYNKLSVWWDGYYITDNGPMDVWVLDRTAALAGDASASIQGFVVNGIAPPSGGGFTSAQVFNVTDDNLPTTGGAPLVYMRDDSAPTVNEDAVWVYDINVDFANPANSNVSTPQEFPVTPFINVFDGGGFANLTQPGGGSDIDAIQATIMNQAQFRKFPTHNSALFNFVVDVDAGPGELAGIRWYELRQDGDGMPWSIFQEGTFTAPDGRHAWMGSMAMDNQGNIGLGYSSMAGPTTPNPTDFRVGSYYTGRFSSDDPGVMSIAEEQIGVSTANIPGIRYGDYAKMDIDPSNDQEFWFINEYLNTNHVAVFQIAPDADNDVGVVNIDTPVDGDLSALQDVTVSIFNFGLNNASNFEVSYTIDGGAPVVEVFTGTIASASTAQYTFTQQADLSIIGQTYVIQSCTNLTSDENNTNDCISIEVTHLNPNDVGVTTLVAPTSGSGLSTTENVTIEITNFGSTTQTSIPVFYTIDGGTPIMETYNGSIAQGATDTYTFTVTQDLSQLGDFVFIAGTELSGDADTSNDDITETVSSFICMPTANCSDPAAPNGDGVTQLQLADQDIGTNCGTDPAGYSDDTDIIFNFILDENPFEGTLQVGFPGSTFAIWIDFNDDNDFAADELVLTDVVAAADANFDFIFDLNLPTLQTGMHRMRVKGQDTGSAGDPLDPCGDATFGRTNDYTANISGVLGTNDTEFASTDLEIRYLPGDQFEVIFNNTTSFQERLPITVYNTLGQALAYYTIENNGIGFSKTIDMSHVASGVYFIRVGDSGLNKVAKIVVN